MQKGFKTSIFLVPAILIVLAIILYTVFSNGNGNYEFYRVKKQDVVESVEIAGTVQSANFADLGFEVSGRVVSLPFSLGDSVEAGDLIARLDTSGLEADLQDALNLVNIKRSELENAGSNLEKVTNQQNVLVKNAYEELLSSDLEAIPRSRNSTLDPPLISGKYTGEEGQYKIEIEKDNVHDQDYMIDVFGIERFGGIVQQVKANPLGTFGLFVRLPASPSEYNETIWFVNIPNTEGDSYTTNLNAYQKAVEDREVAIEEAEKNINSGGQEYSILMSEIMQAEARAEKIRSQIADHEIRAPFDGEIANINIELGEIAGAGEMVVSLISEGDFEVRLDVPEIDIAKVGLGDKAEVFLDAFGDDVSWMASVSKFSRGATYVDGVPVYETILVLEDSEDNRIRFGLSAIADLVTDERENVIAVPAEFITKDDTGYYVHVSLEEDKLERRYIELGLRGSDGMVEVIEGLKEDELIAVAIEE